MTPELKQHLDSADAITSMAYDCVAKKFNDEALLHLGMLGVTLARLRAEVDNYRVDAERYRYVRAYQDRPEGDEGDPAFVEMWRKATAEGKRKPNGADLDSAIDAARKPA